MYKDKTYTLSNGTTSGSEHGRTGHRTSWARTDGGLQQQKYHTSTRARAAPSTASRQQQQTADRSTASLAQALGVPGRSNGAAAHTHVPNKRGQVGQAEQQKVPGDMSRRQYAGATHGHAPDTSSMRSYEVNRRLISFFCFSSTTEKGGEGEGAVDTSPREGRSNPSGSQGTHASVHHVCTRS